MDEVEALLEYLERVHEAFLPIGNLAVLSDAKRLGAFGRAVERAVGAGARTVLASGPGAPVLAMLALRAGAARAAICEPRGSLSALARALLGANALAGQIDLVARRSDFRADLVVDDGIDAALAGDRGARAIPRRATVHAALAEFRTGVVEGFDLSAFDRYRWNVGSEDVDPADRTGRLLSTAGAVLRVDLTGPPRRIDGALQLEVLEAGAANALVAWFDLELDDVETLSSGPGGGCPSWGQSLQYLERAVDVRPGDRVHVSARHDEGGVALALAEPPVRRRAVTRIEPSVMPWHFPMLADLGRNRAFEQAIARAVRRRGGARVLDVGTGTGLLAMMAARAGAAWVVGCEATPHLARLAREVVAANGLADRVSVVDRWSNELSVPGDLPERANVLVSETVDHGLLGEGFVPSLLDARERLLVPDAIVIPCGARVRGAVVSIRPPEDLEPDLGTAALLAIHRDARLDLRRCPHRVLSEIFDVFDLDFRSRAIRPERRRIDARVEEAGAANAVAYWFELRLDDETSIDTSPASTTTAWEQAIAFFDREGAVRPGERLALRAEHDLRSIRFALDPAPDVRLPDWVESILDRGAALLAEGPDVADHLLAMPCARSEAILSRVVAEAPRRGLERRLVADFVHQLGYQAPAT